MKNNGDSEHIYKMEETNNDLYEYSIDANIKDENTNFYFTAEDERGNLTKFPSGRIGKYFIYESINNKTELENNK